jgi:glutamate/tyrosine decarboxylase-like PLP-dependent enzyme
MSVQTFGVAAFRRAVSKGMELAARAEEYVQKSQSLEMLTPVSLSVVCFRVNPADTGLDEEALEKINRNVLARVFWEDRGFMSSTLLKGTFALRLCILNHTTTWDDVRETLEAVERFGREVLSKGRH